MPVIARDAVASDQLVFAWPFPIGPDDYEVSCADDELVVMCPSFVVGDRLGPGRHRWRTPDPMRPASAYFVRTAPVEVAFDTLTQFMIPATGQAVRIRATGSLHVRCMDAALLIAQFVGLPFDHVNDGVLRSVSRSVERMLARLLTRRVVMAGTPNAVTDPQMLANIIEELVAYNPAAGAVFGIELVRMGHVSIFADDGSRPWQQMGPNTRPDTRPLLMNGRPSSNLVEPLRRPDSSLVEPVRPPRPEPVNLLETVRQVPPPAARPPQPSQPIPRAQNQSEASGEIIVKNTGPSRGYLRPEKTTAHGHAAAAAPITPPTVVAADPRRALQTITPSQASRPAGSIDVPQSTPELKLPSVDAVSTPVREGPSPAAKAAAARAAVAAANDARPTPREPHGAIMGIGMSAIGSRPTASSTVAGEIQAKIAPGGRVLVPGPNGLMQSATVRQLLQGYYELEVGGSGETIWVPINGVVPE